MLFTCLTRIIFGDIINHLLTFIIIRIPALRHYYLSISYINDVYDDNTHDLLMYDVRTVNVIILAIYIIQFLLLQKNINNNNSLSTDDIGLGIFFSLRSSLRKQVLSVTNICILFFLTEVIYLLLFYTGYALLIHKYGIQIVFLNIINTTYKI